MQERLFFQEAASLPCLPCPEERAPYLPEGAMQDRVDADADADADAATDARSRRRQIEVLSKDRWRCSPPKKDAAACPLYAHRRKIN
jgi:hypothetical protein